MTEDKSKEEELAVDIFYDKSPQFRTIHPGGAWVAITPELEIQVLFFTNLAPIPEYVKQQITDAGGLGNEIDKIVKKGISREYEVAVVLKPLVARQVVDLLNRMLDVQAKAEAQATEAPATSEIIV